MCNYDFALIFLTLWFCPSLQASQRDFAPSEQSKQGQIHKDQGQNRVDLLGVKGKITIALQSEGQEHKKPFIYYSGINKAVYGSAFSYSPNAAALFKKM